MKNKSFGKTLKHIRESRGLSQEYVARDIVSRTSISKIENGKQEPTISNAQKLIAKLDLDSNEFFYIQNNYKFGTKNSILRRFMNLSETTQTEPISNIIDECNKYLSISFDIQVDNILLVLQCLQDFENGKVDNKFNKTLEAVWERLSKIDNWLIIDLFLINNILYFFPFDTAYNMTFQALKIIQYKYPHMLTLKNAFYLNISFLLMRRSKKKQAIDYLHRSIEISEIIHRYDLLLLAKIRLSICKENYDKIEEYCNLLEGIGAKRIVTGVKKEFFFRGYTQT